jgi:hypothetical protein
VLTFSSSPSLGGAAGLVCPRDAEIPGRTPSTLHESR